MPRPRIPDRRQRILDAAESLILDRGFDGMSVNMLASRVGIGKGALYLEFADKVALVDELIARSMRRVVGNARQQLAASPDVATDLGELYRVTAVALLDDAFLTAAYLDDVAVLGSYVQARDDGRYHARLALSEEYVEALQRDGLIRGDVDTAALTLALSAFTVGLLSLSRVVGPVDCDQLQTAITTFGEMVDRGLRPDDVPERAEVTSSSGGRLGVLLERLDRDNEPDEETTWHRRA